MPSAGPVRPASAARVVAVAAAATVGVTGAAVALHGPATPTTRAETAAPGRAALVVPAPAVPGPGTALAPSSGAPGAPTPAVLDADALRRAVARARSDAHRIVEERRDSGAAPGSAAAAQEDRDARARADTDTAEENRTAERARRAGRAAEAVPAAGCDLPTGELGAVKPHVRAAAEFLGCAFGEPEVLGVAGRGGPSDHPAGRALDFVVDRATGDRLAACAIRNRAALNVTYVIWRQRIDTGDGFRPMEDRGSPTANHVDHVHVSFGPSGGTGDPTVC